MRAAVSALLLAALAACTPPIPDSGRGVGFDNSADAQRARELALTGGNPSGQLLVPPTTVSSETIPPAGAAPVYAGSTSAAYSSNASDIAAETAAALAASSQNSGQAPLQASPSNPTPQVQNNPGISDENDFGAVSNRQTIESDANRIAQNRQQYQVVAPTAVPSRVSGAQPNIVSYALQTSHPRGTRVYSRGGINMAAKAQRACAGFASPDQAQMAFLDKGGPQKDRLGVDPDGDGYACAWNPAPFRQAVTN